MQIDFDIESFMSLEGYDTEIRRDRRKGGKKCGTQEFFTPYDIVKRMADKICPEDWQDPSNTFLDPCCGNGQFILMILYRRIYEYGIDWKTALSTMYAVELMQDNVLETRQRIHELLRNIVPDYDPVIADHIMDKNLVCHDFFTWNFQEWRPMTDDEIKTNYKK